MNETAEHESRFHDQGEHVDDPYPQQSEHPLRAGVGKITDAASAPVYTITEQVWTGAAWTNGTAPGQYVSVSARDFNSDTTGAADDLIVFWEQYTRDGVIELVCAIGAINTDEKVATADGETADFLENVVAGHDPWIVITESGGTLTWTHGPPGASCYCCSGPCIIGIDLDAVGQVRRFYTDAWYGPCA